jgi:sugar phosphate isomerase/epimerase
MKKFALCFILSCCFADLSHAQHKLLKEAPGVVSYTFRNEFAKDVPGTLDKIKGMGITNIEFSSLFGKTPGELRSMLDARGMQCTSLGVGYDDLLKDADKVISTAKTLDAEFVRVASIPHAGNFDDLDAGSVKKAAIDFDTFGKKLYENSLTFCYHNHGPEFKPAGELGSGTFFDYLVQKTNPKYVSFEMDALWVYWPGQDPVALLKKYPERFKLMHVKNVKKGITRGTSPVNVPVGDGQINMTAVLRAAQNTAVKYFYIEDESAPEFVDTQVLVSIKFMKELTK